jgi:hypothetical protein
MTPGDWVIASVIAAALVFVLFGAVRGALMAWHCRKTPDDDAGAPTDYGADRP